MTAPLKGLRILELSSYVATPLCGLVLHQLGADVVRLEPPGGAPDRTRLPLSETGTSMYWAGLNKGKQAIAVDLRTPDGAALAADLAVDAGIVVTNGAHRGPLATEALRERRPDLIHVRLSGTPDGGPAVDYTVQAETGFPLVTGPGSGGTPVNQVLPAWDIAAGLYLATGLLAAVHRRQQTGEGATITLALEDVALSTAGTLGLLTEAQTRGIDRGPDGNHVYGTYGRDFQLADGRRIMLVILTDRHWRSLLEVTGLTDTIAALQNTVDADFSLECVRYQHRALISALLEPWFAARTLPDVGAALEGTRILLAVYLTFDQVAADLADRPLFTELDQPGVGPHLAPAGPLAVDGSHGPVERAPAPGEHTHWVLADLGLTAEQITRLAHAGVIDIGATTRPDTRSA